ncbi:MAG TPA: hypothetical protein DCP25_15365 [Chloroflexi bacterium]|jgi:transcriptional regulator with XRE-family HTH domain|nr:hypothetical protein [Chloroflexota bacterium]
MAITKQALPIENGRDLAAERVRSSLRAADVAERMGVSRQRITNIEQLHRVPPALRERYLRALAAALEVRPTHSSDPALRQGSTKPRGGAR